MKFSKPNRRTYETYSHLEAKQLPTPYEIVTSKLLYYPNTGFAIKNPVTDWYKRYQHISCNEHIDWSGFYDPKNYIYTTYVQDRQKQEVYLNDLSDSLGKEFSLATSNREWLEILESYYAPLVFPFHGFQMIAAYIGQMAPNGRISVCAAFQAADEMRRIQRIAFHTAQMRCTHPTFGENRQSLWEEGPVWQPLREAVENLLITYDWVEALIALNVYLKPLVASLFLVSLEDLSKKYSNPLLENVLKSFCKDEHWHREWSSILIHYILDRSEDKGDRLLAVQAKWEEKALNIVRSCSTPLGRTHQEVVSGLRYHWRQISERLNVEKASMEREAA